MKKTKKRYFFTFSHYNSQLSKVHIYVYGLSKNKIKKCYSKTLICTFVHLAQIIPQCSFGVVFSNSAIILSRDVYVDSSGI